MTSNTPPSGASDLEALLGVQLAGRYVLQRQVGSGSTTAIFEAADAKTDRIVTFKLIRPRLAAVPEFAAGFDAELRSAAELRHPNIAAIYDWGYTEVADTRSAFVVTERLTGGSLRDLFDRGRLLSPSQALAVGLDACKALDHAHRRGNVHTELTPAKIVFGDDRRLRIVDFGLSRLIGGLMWMDPSNVPNHVAWYAAPEQALAEPVTGRTDVYALSMILTESMTGDVPFKDASTTATLNNRVGKLLPVSADMGPLASVLEHAARPDAEDRFSAAGFGKNLVHTATRLPRPEPLPLLSSGLFETAPERLRAPSDPTGGVTRPGTDRPTPQRTPQPTSETGAGAPPRPIDIEVQDAVDAPGIDAPQSVDYDDGDDDTFDGRADFDIAARAVESSTLDRSGLEIDDDGVDDYDDGDDYGEDDYDDYDDGDDYGEDDADDDIVDEAPAVGKRAGGREADLYADDDDYDDDDADEDVDHDVSDQYGRVSEFDDHRGDVGDRRDPGDDYDVVDDDYDDLDDDDLDDGDFDDGHDDHRNGTIETRSESSRIDELLAVDDFEGDESGAGTGEVIAEQLSFDPVDLDPSGEQPVSNGAYEDDDLDDEDHGADEVDIEVDETLAESDDSEPVEVGVIDLSGIDMSPSSASGGDELATGVVPVLGIDEDEGQSTAVVPVTRVEADPTGLVAVVGADSVSPSDSGSVTGGHGTVDTGYSEFAADDPGYGSLDYGDFGAGDLDGSDFGSGDLGAAAAAGSPPVPVDYEGLEPDRERRRRFPIKTMLGLLVVIGLVAVAIFAFRLLSTNRYVVPNLVNQPIDEAQLLIASNGWDVSVTHERSDVQPKAGLIIRTSPPAGEEVAEGEPFEMVVSDGPVQRELPDLAGVEANEAQRRLQSLGMVVTVEKAHDETVPAGMVIRWYVPDQDLQPGAMVDPGTDVILVVSDGPAPREMPNLVGLPVDQARSGLAELGLTLAIDAEEANPTIPKGSVAEQSSPPGTMVARGAEIRVVVSKGLTELTFPDLSGVQGFEAAKAALEEAGFKVFWQLGDQTSTDLVFYVGDVEPKPGDVFPIGTEVAVESR